MGKSLVEADSHGNLRRETLGEVLISAFKGGGAAAHENELKVGARDSLLQGGQHEINAFLFGEPANAAK